MKDIIKVRPQIPLKFVLFGGLLVGLYYSAYSWLIQKDWTREDHSYCSLIPLVVLYLIWEKKGELGARPAMPSWFGLLPLIPGILLFWVGDLAGELYSLYLSSWLVAVGILWMHIGWQKLKVIAFALLMALAMFPLPHFLNTKLTFSLRLISSKLGVWLLHLYGMSAYREGNVIDLGFTQLQVVDACSGLRYLFPLLVMGILLAYFYRAALWKRIVLVLSTVPLTIVTNSLRIALTGIIHAYWGAEAAEGFFHGFSGWLIFIVALAVMLAEMWILRKIEGRGKKEDGSEKKEEGRQKTEIQDSKPFTFHPSPFTLKALRAFISPPQFIVAVILLGLTLAFSYGIEFREKIPIKKSLDHFPLKVNEWSGAREAMEQKFIDALDLSDYVIVDYKDKSGKQVNFYVAYYESQRKGESIHSPESCLPGSGWEFREAGAVNIPLTKSSLPYMRVNRAFMAKHGVNQIVYFWFPQRGRILTNAYQLKIYAFWDALTRQRTDGALVRLITPITQGERVEDAEKRLQDFTRQIVPVLNEFIPN
ncbi:MAG: VPLPA-CTERM-specific exosortase XrtD [Deltaproteobacteria bacterium]|nr:VPLPA-CTERM-specific exosortase XrtD [Deltaproteobacteria bacterium]